MVAGPERPKTGLRDLFAIAFLHIESRRVFITPGTYNPVATWDFTE